MKAVAVIALLCCVAAASSLGLSRGLKHELIQKVGSKIFQRAGVLPPFEHPLLLNDSSIELNTTNLIGTIDYWDTQIHHLDELIDDLRINLLTLDIDITIDLARGALIGNYNVDGHYTNENGTMHITGTGPVTGQLTTLRVTGGGRLQVIIITNRVRIINVRATVGFADAEIWPENSMADGEPIDWEAINANLKAEFDQFWQANQDDIIQLVTDALNEFFGQYTLSELIACLVNGGCW